jgi:hypothetical protein
MKLLFSPEDIERKVLLVLKILNENQEPMGARLISRHMKERGVELSERTVRYHLKIMDERGLTTLVGNRDGRMITDAGRDEISHARVQDKIGLSISRIDVLSYQSTFDLKKKQGTVPVNVSFFPKDQFHKILEAIKPPFTKKIAVSDRIAIAEGGSRLGEIVVPDGKVGLATVCSILINAVLLRHGIPIDSRFGGILQVKNGIPLRFVELIHYSGSSLDPSEIFISGKMTSVRQVVEEGEGKILANFREIPFISLSLVEDIVAQFRQIGIEGVLSMGTIGHPICQTSVDAQKVGMILIGGLNPVAYIHEKGFEVDNHAMSAVMEFDELRRIWDI